MKQIFKKIKIKYAAVLLTFAAVSCQSEFLETTPTDRLGYTDVVEKPQGLMNIINGIHRDMYVRTPYGQGYNGQTGAIVMFDSMADDLVHTGTGVNWHVADLRWLSADIDTSTGTNYPWRFYYKIIGNANIVIDNAPKVFIESANQATETALRDKALGEAYAYRAWAFFQLVQIYSKRYDKTLANNDSDGGIILRLTNSLDPMKRSTVKETYDQIHEDLNKAIALLTGKTRDHKSQFNVNVAKGIKARVYLTQQEWALAAQFANEARGTLPLMTNAEYVLGFNKIANNEWMWASEILPDNTDYFGNFGAYMSRNYNSSTIRTAPKAIYRPLYDAFPSTDIRKANFDPTGNHTSLGLPSNYTKRPYTSQKFLSVSVSDSRCDVPYMRVAEMLLIESEALARNGQETASKAVFEILAKNRNPVYTSTNTGAAYITEIMNSRRMELWGEGFRWFDLKRLNLPVERNKMNGVTVAASNVNHVASVINSTYTIPTNDPRWQFKIPRQEIDSNPLCKQNQ
ncbi:RagB/SusD family nutrient uptake outer membrane protein [uncultured Chryseobacterium sp.]|uniref:RagB/SusD family nutrient uptake outer membrane protein n=1 Tax=uncultured Chryseobacterium sp. TaxID=259322 RepID=UPI0025E84C32|nr:RagB/SusD family nutrient uptake outer membrane protein [uncultured Chryseobacterium sp.]